MEATYAASRVVKRLSASQPGARKHARRYGETLVCVRYRHDATGRIRYTTVELVIDEAPVVPRKRLDDIVLVHIAYEHAEQHRQARARGARWDSKLRLWRMTRRAARALRLEHAIIHEAPRRR